MPEYRCYFRDSDRKIKAAEVLDCEDDTAAAVQAELLLAERPNCRSAEVWEGRRLIHRATRA
jgi:hypothetical protein